MDGNMNATGKMMIWMKRTNPLSARPPDESVVDTVNRKTFPRGDEISYSHVVFDKKYKVYPETKRNVFLKWKSRLVFDGIQKNLTKSHSHIHLHYHL